MNNHPYGPFGAPNPGELRALPSDLFLMEKFLRETFPDVDPPPERRTIIEAFVNVLRAAHAYAAQAQESAPNAGRS